MDVLIDLNSIWNRVSWRQATMIQAYRARNGIKRAKVKAIEADMSAVVGETLTKDASRYWRFNPCKEEHDKSVIYLTKETEPEAS